MQTAIIPITAPHLRVLPRPADQPTMTPERRHVTVIADDVVRDVLTTCGMAAGGMYMHLERCVDATGCCHPSYATIAADCGIARRYAIVLIEKLVAAGFVEVYPQRSARGLPDANVFHLPRHPSNTSQTIPSEHGSEQALGNEREGSERDGEHLTRARQEDKVVRSRGGSPLSPPKPTKSPIPDDFAVTEEMRQKACGYGVDADRVDFETDKFLDHFRATGEKKVDWVAAWRNWMRRSLEYAPRRPTRASPNGKRGYTAAELLAMSRDSAPTEPTGDIIETKGTVR